MNIRNLEYWQNNLNPLEGELEDYPEWVLLLKNEKKPHYYYFVRRFNELNFLTLAVELEYKFKAYENTDSEGIEPLKIWMIENLIKLIKYWLENYAIKSRAYSNYIKNNSEKQTDITDVLYSKLYDEFINPIIKSLDNLQQINKNININYLYLNKEYIELKLSYFKSDLQNLLKEHVKILGPDSRSNSGSNSSNSDNEIIDDKNEVENEVENVPHLLFDKTDVDLTDAISALKIVSLDDVDNKLKVIIAENKCLKMALAASYRYHSTNKQMNKWYGRLSTERFIKNLIDMNNKSDANIRNEALNYVRGGKHYSRWWWFGGGSSHHANSRISYMVGLFNGRIKQNKNQNKLKQFGLFNQKMEFNKLGSKQRKLITKTIQSMPAFV